MISTTKTEDGFTMRDQSAELATEAGEEVVKIVKAAMAAGLTEFTTPTTANGEGRIDWKVKKFFTMQKGKPVCHLVACKAGFEHFEVLGPEASFGDKPQAAPAK